MDAYAPFLLIAGVLAGASIGWGLACVIIGKPRLPQIVHRTKYRYREHTLSRN